MTELITTELMKFDAVTPKIEEIIAEYMPLRINGIDDTDGYAAVVQALKFVVKKINEVEDKRKELKADSLAYGRAVDARAKEITAMLEPIKSHLRQQREAVDAEKERIAAEREQQRQNLINNRITALMSISGVFQTMTEFVWASKIGGEEITFMKINLETFDEEQFGAVYERIKSVSEAEQAEIQKREAAQKAEAQRLEKERLELEAERQRVQKEIEDMKTERAAGRISALKELGVALNNLQTHYGYFVKAEPYRFENLLHIDEIRNATNAQFEDALLTIKSALEKLRAEEAESLSRHEAAMAEKIRAELEARAEAEKQARIEEEKRVAKTKAEKFDVKALVEFFEYVKTSNKQPQLFSEYGKRIHQNFLTYIDDQLKKLKP